MDPSNLLTEQKLSTLKGIGEKTEKLFGKTGICNLDQLLHYYPRAYDACLDCVPLSELVPGNRQAVFVRVKNPPAVRGGGRTPVTVLNISEGGAKLTAVWFNMPYLRSVLKPGEAFVLRGMVVNRASALTMEHPEVYTQQAYEEVRGSIQPVYALTAGLRNKMVAKAVRQIFDRYAFCEYLPETIREPFGLTDRETALRQIHFPKSEADLAQARRRIVFDEFLFYLLRLGRLHESDSSAESFWKIQGFSRAEQVRSDLPYELTAAQARVWQEIRSDLSSGQNMNRLLQGDVGSGKTIVAFLAMIAAMEAGYQCALMVPTEVLAEQHYTAFCSLLAEHGMAREGVVLLNGSLTAKEKRAVHEKIRAGEAKAVIGTHAIIQAKVEFARLALVVTDEQHRFGVRQRERIGQKGEAPHVLVMSATPIPRTLALILYGDLQISVLDELPARRLKIKNCVVDPSYRKTAYAFMQKEIAAGHQAYVICPMIEPNEDLGCENVLEYTQRLRKLFAPQVCIEMLHGQMRPEEKSRIMRDFARNRIQILVSTTVVEVGVDVPNATVMLIENAERFGLAQLHQLRGRIGRGDAQSYCIFLQGDGNAQTNERLQILNHSNDGFAIAREDLKLRGQGDLFGLRQSGDAGFLLANPLTDAETLKEAAQAAEQIRREDPLLASPAYDGLRRMLESFGSGLEEVL